GLLSKIPVKNVKQFEAEFLTMLRNKHKDVLDALKQGKLDDTITGTLEKVAADLVKSLDN
ncbi:MAG: F0F1 ATP synthase subunit alpha, partial [Flavobacteriales bacterium]|nr:F0F1 ATP synthase subunit alpha [Flavobacteriales bacterium]